MELSLKNPWVIGGGVIGLGLIGYYLYTNASSGGTDTVTGIDQGIPTGGAVGVPTSIGAGTDSTGLGGGTDALNALTNAITELNAGTQASDAVQLASINASQLAHQEDVGASIFQTLNKSLNAHKGLGRISATIPGLGDVSTWYGKPVRTVTKVITKPAPKPAPKKPLPKAHLGKKVA